MNCAGAYIEDNLLSFPFLSFRVLSFLSKITIFLLELFLFPPSLS